MASSYEILIDAERSCPVLHENRFSEVELFSMFAVNVPLVASVVNRHVPRTTNTPMHLMTY